MDISWQVGSRLLSIVMAALVGCYLCVAMLLHIGNVF
jgi:hypothetical protein